jgi:hypothetical protein
MNRLREQRWLILVAVLVVVFLAAVSMHMERMRGWGFLILCFVVGSLGGLGVMWVRDRALLNWSRLPKSRKRIAITTGVPLILVGTFVANRHKPDELANDVLMCFAVLVALLFWGLYRIMSRFLDALHERLSRH